MCINEAQYAEIVKCKKEKTNNMIISSFSDNYISPEIPNCDNTSPHSNQSSFISIVFLQKKNGLSVLYRGRNPGPEPPGQHSEKNSLLPGKSPEQDQAGGGTMRPCREDGRCAKRLKAGVKA